LGDPAELLLLTDDAEYGPDDAESDGGGGILTDIGCPLPPLRPVLGLIFFHQTAIYMSRGASSLRPDRAQPSPTKSNSSNKLNTLPPHKPTHNCLAHFVLTTNKRGNLNCPNHGQAKLPQLDDGLFWGLAPKSFSRTLL
jgi:hypothetical protein